MMRLDQEGTGTMATELVRVEARAGRAVRLAAGDRLAVVNTYGTQVVDFWALCLPDATEHLSMVHARSALRRLRPRVGDALVTSRRRAILHLVGDTSPGVHDTLIAACDPERYRQLGVDGHHANCRDNFRAAVAAIGIDRTDVPDPLNLFMNFTLVRRRRAGDAADGRRAARSCDLRRGNGGAGGRLRLPHGPGPDQRRRWAGGRRARGGPSLRRRPVPHMQRRGGPGSRSR